MSSLAVEPYTLDYRAGTQWFTMIKATRFALFLDYLSMAVANNVLISEICVTPLDMVSHLDSINYISQLLSTVYRNFITISNMKLWRYVNFR